MKQMWKQFQEIYKTSKISIDKPENDWTQCQSPEDILDDLEKEMQTSTGQMGKKKKKEKRCDNS